MKDEVILLKLSASFAEIICKVDGDVADKLIKKSNIDSFTVTSPFLIQMQRDENGELATGLHALSLMMEGDPKDAMLNLHERDILFAARPTKDIQKQYREMVSGIHLVS